MFRLRSLHTYPLRVFHCGAVYRDQVLVQLQACTEEDHVFSMVGKNKAKFSADHVGYAIGMLWQFQKERPEMLRRAELIRGHPEFLTLRVLAENKISLMDDATVVDMLYNIIRLRVDPHDSLVQHLMIESWNRLERFPMSTLSKFSICLTEQFFYCSPLMGQITEIVSQKLDSIEDARILTIFMISVCALVSPRLRDALIKKADILLDSMDPFYHNNPRRIVQFLRNIKYAHRPLLEKCNHILLQNIPHMDAENLCIILGLYQSLQYSNCDFTLAAKQRLMELMDSSTDPVSFTKLFIALGPLAGQGPRKVLESAALLMANELNSHQALAVLQTLEDIQCLNLQLINKIASVLQKNLEIYRSADVAKITQLLINLHYKNPELFARLRTKLLHYLQDSVYPHEVTILTRVLSMLPFPLVEEVVLSRIDAVMPQCGLNDLSSFTMAIAKWIRSDPTYHYNTPSKYVRLLQTLNHYGRGRLHKADRLDLMLEELKYISMEWFREILLEDTIAMLQRLEDQVSWTNVSDLALFLTKTNCLCTPLLDRIADVAIENMHQIHYSATYEILLPFCLLNYDSPRVDKLFEACLQRLTPHISSFDPHLLIFTGCALAVVNRFPEEIIREIFSVDFLSKLDAQLETLPDTLNMRVRLRLMELNRAVCLECPEFQVPWFHERYCKQFQRKYVSVSPKQKQIHKMLGEVLGGINCARVAVLTPYFYTVDFECVLDRHNQAVPYSEPNQLQITENGNVNMNSGSPDKERNELPLGCRRIALDFLDSKCYSKNSHHIRGEVLMRKRHLEILGYHVLQIPHFEWNSMALSTNDAWKEYLRKKLFTEQAQDS